MNYHQRSSECNGRQFQGRRAPADRLTGDAGMKKPRETAWRIFRSSDRCINQGKTFGRRRCQRCLHPTCRARWRRMAGSAVGRSGGVSTGCMDREIPASASGTAK